MKILCVIVLLTLVSMSNSIGFTRIQVRIMNRRGNGKSITIHCQSEDDDLGTHVVSDGQEINWSFRENFMLTTRFYCYLQWDRKGKHFNFDAYSGKRDDGGRCSTECLWKILEGGLWGYDQEQQIWQAFSLPGMGEKEV
uniref:S-protein homolog n=1 Tax=Papaver rhoeas TaxID=33128 RepID=Q42433_PAPRH|nr:S3 self-incompatibility protein [Papaver rhoeas]CAA60579.1 S3 self-incompatibility protein [Papaver rhoeas]